MAAPRPGQVGDLGFHQLGHHLQPDRGRGGQQPLADVLSERGQMPVDGLSEHTAQPSISARDELQRAGHTARFGTGVVSGRGRVRTWHWGSSRETWWFPGASHTSRSERRTPTSSSTDPGTTSFGDTIDFDHIKRHYYQVHTDVNPTGIVPAGPELSNWLEAHGREQLGGRPFGDGTPPRPPAPDELVPAEHSPAGRASAG